MSTGTDVSSEYRSTVVKTRFVYSFHMRAEKKITRHAGMSRLSLSPSSPLFPFGERFVTKECFLCLQHCRNQLRQFSKERPMSSCTARCHRAIGRNDSIETRRVVHRLLCLAVATAPRLTFKRMSLLLQS